MYVFNNCLNDARVLKEAFSVSEMGHEVEIVAFLDKKTTPFERKSEAVTIRRIAINALHLRILRAFSNPFAQQEKTPDGGKKAKSKIAGWLGPYRQNPLVRALAFLFGGLFFLVYKASTAFTALFRKVGSFVMRVLRYVLHRPIKFLLMPYHKFFVYYDFYKQGVKIGIDDPADVVHCHDLNTLKIGTTLKKRVGSKLVYDSHELYLHKNRIVQPGRFKKRVMRRIEAAGMKAADKVITVGGCIADWMANEYGAPTPEVVLNTPGYREDEPDMSKSLRAALGLNSDQWLMVYSGGITFNRGLENIIEAVAQVDELQFVMMGYGTEAYLDSIKKLITTHKVEERVHFFGPVEHHEVSSYLSSADFGIAPILNVCLSYYYCSPNKLFEFVQARLPVLASNFPEMEKVVEDYDIGLTFEPSDVSDIVKTIQQMIADKGKMQYYRQNTEKAAHAFNWENESQKLKTIYKELAS